MLFWDFEIILTQIKIYSRYIFILPYRKMIYDEKNSLDINMSEHRWDFVGH